LIEREGNKIELYSYWRVLQGWPKKEDDEIPLSDSEGNSAGGAAALGWYRLLDAVARRLSSPVYDERIIVLAQIDNQGNLSKVDGILEKAKAIAADGNFDTIVVADVLNEEGTDNQTQAEKALKDDGKDRSIRVVNLCDE
jgi:hypothetical protein